MLSSKLLRVSVRCRAADILPPINYEDVSRLIKQKHVKAVEVSDKSKIVTITTDKGLYKLEVPESKNMDFMNKIQTHDVDLTIKHEIDVKTVIEYFLQFVLIGLPVLLFLQLTSKKNNSFNFGQSLTTECQNIDTTFEEVAGLKNAKQDLMEIVEFLKNPEKFSKLGAKIPKGCLLSGPSGVGKTLVARAIAGEAGVPFFYSSASEFVQMFVGVGSSRIRDMFAKASEKAPCIIFIDEIDAIGKTRGMGFNGGNDEREQTINQLLVEMDGFKGNQGVIVIAATNRADVLDPALMRAGRFDRHIYIELPEFKDRMEILRVHTKNKPLEENFDYESVCRATSGFSGADIANIANEAAILAARNNQKVITQAEFENALDKIALGAKKDTVVSDEKKWLVAYHEAGHALVGYLLGDSIKKISIIARGKTGGVTMFETEDDGSGLYSKEYLENQIAIALGGRASEEIVYGKQMMTTGASGDISVIQNIARHMVTSYGLNEKLGPIAWPDVYSQETMSSIDNEIKKIVSKSYAKTKLMITKHRKYLDTIAEALVEKETITGSDLVDIMLSS